MKAVSAIVIACVGAVICVGAVGAAWSVWGQSLAGRSLPAAICPIVAPVKVGQIVVPAGPVAGYCQARLVNAAHIMNAARDQGIGTHTQAVGVMTAIGESGLRVLNHGDVAGEDSRGLFQQRDNGAWGTLADRMDPYVSAQNFFIKLTQVAGWETMSPTLLAHSVQVNADPNHYEAFWADAQSIVAVLGN